jgi:hypothetical protein
MQIRSREAQKTLIVKEARDRERWSFSGHTHTRPSHTPQMNNSISTQARLRTGLARYLFVRSRWRVVLREIAYRF